MKNILLKKAGALLLALVLSFVLPLAFLPTAAAAESNGAHPVTITLHAGDNGYFGDPSVKEKESAQDLLDKFVDDTIPDAVDESQRFMGWSTEPDGQGASVVSGITDMTAIGTDIYAVWGSTGEVVYRPTEGYLQIDDMEYDDVNPYVLTCALGSKFQVLIPKPISNQLKFDGWYTSANGNGVQYTQDSVIDKEEVNVYAKWMPNDDNIEAMQLDTDYELQLDGGGVIYSFVPDETTVYEIFTRDADTDFIQAYIRLLDENLNDIEDAVTIDDKNVSLSRELEKGKKYYFQLSEIFGHQIYFVASIQKADYVTVTFHANLEEGEACFDGDPSVTSKEIHIKKGLEIHKYSQSGLEVADPNKHTFLGWSVDKDARQTSDEGLYADEGMNVYAVYDRFEQILLDANGGRFPDFADAPTHYMNYSENMIFSTVYEPVHKDNNLKFIGWASAPDAEEPDIPEGTTLCSDLPKVIYAVYAEKVLATFDANGGFFFGNPSKTTYQLVLGKGGYFHSLSAMHEDPLMVTLGWKDQNGNEAMNLDDDQPPYFRVYEDSVFTAIWGRKITVDGNGGYFMWNPNLTALRIPLRLDVPFKEADIIDLIGPPLHDDAMKYLAGWATTPDAEEPDILEGETYLEGLDRIYAVWKDDSYYFAEGENGSWAKGSAQGLRFVVKRTGDDAETYPHFSGVQVDQTQLTTESFDAKEGSVILTLKPTYLEGLALGEHTLTLLFGEDKAETKFTVTEKTTPIDPVDPDTPDDPVKPDDQHSGVPGTILPDPSIPAVVPASPASVPVSPAPASVAVGAYIPQDSPKTADGSHPLLWSWLMASALLGFAAIGLRRPKSKKNR